jgi:hypothetical protein
MPTIPHPMIGYDNPPRCFTPIPRPSVRVGGFLLRQQIICQAVLLTPLLEPLPGVGLPAKGTAWSRSWPFYPIVNWMHGLVLSSPTSLKIQGAYKAEGVGGM